jgi:hypothetical protein
MEAFLTPNPVAFADLARRARGQCMRFRGQRLPGAVPEAVDVGFEIDADSGRSILWLQKGVHWSVQDLSVKVWLEQGRIDFDSFDALQGWLMGPLQREYHAALERHAGSRDDATAPTAAPRTPPSTDELTGWAAVENGLAASLGTTVLPDEADLYNVMAETVFGQERALRRLAHGCTQHLARLMPMRPEVFFAVGPTGVGKTRSAEALAEALNRWCVPEARWRTLRLDMSEYQEAHRVSQLIGAPQGYLGYGDKSQLVDALTQHKRWVIVFDEIEKAHPAILTLLMNGMDAGRISSASSSGAQGHQLDCRQCMFYFTSNLDATGIQREVDEAGPDADHDELCRRRLKATGIAPEIVERIGHCLVFLPIAETARAKVVLMAIVETAREFGLEVRHVAPELLLMFLQEGRNFTSGARAERRLIGMRLGSAFVQARRDGLDQVRLLADPPRCQPTH